MVKVCSSLQPYALALLRIVTGFTFALHGLQKLAGAFGGMDGHATTVPMFSLLWFAGVLEIVGGPLIILGLLTRPVAFLLSGEMAVAYFTVHLPLSFWPPLNTGESPILFCFIFLYLVTSGPGSFSLDRLRQRP
jgi:putative oxidoreductase